MLRPSLRLAPKLMLALVGVSLVGVVVAGVSFRQSLDGSFNKLITDEAADHFTFDVMNYYRENGTLDSVSSLFTPEGPRNRPNALGVLPEGRPRPPAPEEQQGLRAPGAPIAFGLADAKGIVRLHGDGYQEGGPAPADILKRGRKISVDGQFIGTVLPPRRPLPPNQAEADFTQRMDLTLALAAALGTVLATAVGLPLARGITGPVRRLTFAASEVGRAGWARRSQPRAATSWPSWPGRSTK